MSEIDFQRIAPRLSGQREAFEELCSQLVSKTIQNGENYTRLRGAGGDGGVECFSVGPDGTKTGWQAKYVFTIDKLLTQAKVSLQTALNIHPELSRYIICFPFDLTGPTARRGNSQLEKVEEWARSQVKEQAEAGRHIDIQFWPASKISGLLLEHDSSGGIREYFFNERILTEEWFENHLKLMRKAAGPRYTPELSVETDLNKWFDSFGRTENWQRTAFTILNDSLKTVIEHEGSIREMSEGALNPSNAKHLKDRALKTVESTRELFNALQHLVNSDKRELLREASSSLKDLIKEFKELELQFLEKLRAEHSSHHNPDTQNFRQWMAEYQLEFPASQLDATRALILTLEQLFDWLESPSNSLAYEHAFILSGNAGAGKTHGICDVADRRLESNLTTCVCFGHSFGDSAEPWTRLLEVMALPLALGREGVLDMLNAAGEASGLPLILCIDAVNETRPLTYWRERLASFAEAVRSRPYVRVCFSCRTSYLIHAVPSDHELQTIEHLGFKGIEQSACRVFFQYYNLVPPVAPLLELELSNPLYLKLLCLTLKSRGLTEMPVGWNGISIVIAAFITEQEKEYAVKHETSVASSTVGGSLKSIARAIAHSAQSTIQMSTARQVIATSRPNAHPLTLEWLIRADLLVEDAPLPGSAIGSEGTVRMAFERLGDFLVADEILEHCSSDQLQEECTQGGRIFALMENDDAVARNIGTIAALSVLIPERYKLEYTDLVDNPRIRTQVLRISVGAMSMRDPATLSNRTGELLREALSIIDLTHEAMSAYLEFAWRPSSIDAYWLHNVLSTIDLAKRDAFWCNYLHQDYEATGVVRRLIDAAFQLPLVEIDLEVAQRWAVLLMWFTAAADRRVKDRATRAAVRLLASHPSIISDLTTMLFLVKDDDLRERALLASYGALLINPDSKEVSRISIAVSDLYRTNPSQFGHAQIRDLMRGIFELAQELDVLSSNIDILQTTNPAGSSWPITIPTDDELKKWEKLPRLTYSCLSDDFKIYALNSLRPWEDHITNLDAGKWILQYVASDLGYAGSGCEGYDARMVQEYGGGRSSPDWAERIGKKYQWVAMNRLASTLHDHVNRKVSTWDPEQLRTPFILLEERKMDPTLPPELNDVEKNSQAWWMTSEVDFSGNTLRTDAEWVHLKDDLPQFAELLAPKSDGVQKWRTLSCYPNWRSRKAVEDYDVPYRHVWMHIESFLVPEAQILNFYNALHRRNFFGRWMPEGSTWLYGFIGEYPWGTAFNTEPDEYHGRGGHQYELPADLFSARNELAAEWEYDGSLSGNKHISLPAKPLFHLGDLWWNGRDGFRNLQGVNIFRDPSMLEVGPPALLANVSDLNERLRKLGFRLMWTLLGEKQVIGRNDKDSQKVDFVTFSQIALLEEDGSIRIGDRVFFGNDNQDTGPASPENHKD